MRKCKTDIVGIMVLCMPFLIAGVWLHGWRVEIAVRRQAEEEKIYDTPSGWYYRMINEEPPSDFVGLRD